MPESYNSSLLRIVLTPSPSLQPGFGALRLHKCRPLFAPAVPDIGHGHNVEIHVLRGSDQRRNERAARPIGKAHDADTDPIVRAHNASVTLRGHTARDDASPKHTAGRTGSHGFEKGPAR